MNFNKIILGGNLTHSPELKHTTNGKSMCSFTVAYNEKSYDDKKLSYFFNVVVWGKTGENCAKFLKKGSSVLVEGKLTTRSWEGKDGSKKTAYEIIASSVNFVGNIDYSNAEKAESQPSKAEYSGEDVPF